MRHLLAGLCLAALAASGASAHCEDSQMTLECTINGVEIVDSRIVVDGGSSGNRQSAIVSAECSETNSDIGGLHVSVEIHNLDRLLAGHDPWDSVAADRRMQICM